jgi:DNA processing protein
MPVMAEQERLRWSLKLHLAQGVGAVTFARVVEALGSLEAAAAASAGRLEQVQGVGPQKAAAIAAVSQGDIDEELELAERHNVSIICRGDADYPKALDSLDDAPALLYVRGRIEQSDAVAMAVVGSRNCTHYGMEQAERFGGLLGRAGLTVVSGGARGIDTAAHRGALSAGGRTIAVMGCGLLHPYPPENAALFDQIAGGRGAVVSELPMRVGVLAGSFPTRNRLISGLSLGVLVVEAARRSGSLITAKQADKQGRVVMALPGRVDSPLSQGANELIRTGAVLVQDLDDVLEALGPVGTALSPEEHQPAAAAPPPAMDDAQRRLWEALAQGPLTLDELVRATGMPGGQAASAMTMLVLKGAACQHAGSVFARKAPPPAPMKFL